MNMISTGAFLSEMDASNKQSSAAKKFATVWEKKNAKAARAGGVSLMALSLAACGGSSSTTTTSTSTDTTTTTTPATDAAKNLILTKSSVTGSADDLAGGTGDDFFNGKLVGSFETGDTLDGGDGTDTLHFNAGAVTADATIDGSEVKNIENLIVDMNPDNGAGDDVLTIDMSGFAGVQKVTAYHITSGGTTSDAVLTFAGSNMKTSVDLEIVGGDADAANSAYDVTATYQSVTGTADSSNLLLNGAGVNEVSIAGIETLNVTATSTDTSVSAKGYSDVNTLTATSAKTININADSKITIGAIDAAAAVTIDSSDSAGIVVVTGETAATSTTVVAGSGKTTFTTATTGTLKFTGGAAADTLDGSGGNSSMTVDMGAGDDTVKVGAGSNLTAADTVAGGDGTDTLVVTDATFNTAFKTTIKEATGFEILATSSQAAKSFAHDGVSNYDHLKITQASSISAAAATVAGDDAINVTGIAAGDELTITEGQTGQAGGVSKEDTDGYDGGDGIELTPKLDTGANAYKITLVGNADITGGAGGSKGDTETDDITGGTGGIGINATDFEDLTLHIVSNEDTADTVTIGGGAGGATGVAGDTVGTDGSDIKLGTNATLTLTDALTESTNAYSKVNLGTVEGTNVVVDGSALDGALTVTTTNGNTTIKGGSKGDTLKGGAGSDTIEGGAGNDDIQGNAGVDTMTGGAGKDVFSLDENAYTGAQTIVTDIITDFETGIGTDKIDIVNATTRISDASATDVSGAVSGTSDLKATVASGIVTLSGSGTSLVDTIAEVIDIWELLDGAAGVEYGAVVAMGNTYVIAADANDHVEEVIQLTGVTDATAISTTDGDGTIWIA